MTPPDRIDQRDALVARLSEVVQGTEGVTVRKETVRRARSEEFDYSASSRSLSELQAALERIGFTLIRALRDRRHRFMLAHHRAGWVKVDVKVDDAGWVQDNWRILRNILWAGRRRRGPVLAIVGADGAGKSTLINALAQSMPLAFDTAYLGSRWTVRHSTKVRSRSGWRVTAGVTKWGLLNIVRLARIHLRARGGTVVVCDRHPIEAGFLDWNTSGLAAILRRALALYVFPRPDQFILLYAPGSILFSRKGEHSPEALELMNDRLRTLITRFSGIEIDARREPTDVLSDIEAVILELVRRRVQ